jgi:hypothetical protein
MAHPWHHSVSAAKAWGGCPQDYLPVNEALDVSKQSHADFRHRALYHHAEGCFLMERMFGVTITNTDGREIPVRWIAERHINEDLGRIPAATEWLSQIRPQPWMNRSRQLSRELEQKDPIPTGGTA